MDSFSPGRALWFRVFLGFLAILLVGYLVVAEKGARLAANALLCPTRRLVEVPKPENAQEVSFPGVGVTLRGWLFKTNSERRGTIIYLHGIADNRTKSIETAQFFNPRGWDVLAYDGRAHGASTGKYCTYGWWEKQDLRRVVDTLPKGSIVLIGTSLGAAIALQEAADDRRISAVVAAETFSDLRTVANERAPKFFTSLMIWRAFELASHRGAFAVDAASPVAAAPRITAPVLLLHGANDVDTPPDHSRRVYAALRGPKDFILVPNAWHNGSLRVYGWEKIGQWLEKVVPQGFQANTPA